MKHDSKAARTARFYQSMLDMGFYWDEANTLRLAEMALQRWGERQCNGEVEVDDDGKAWTVYEGAGGRCHRNRTPNREAGALRRIKAIVDTRNARHREMHEAAGNSTFVTYLAYHQTDPRGCALYLVDDTLVRKGEAIDRVYSRGFGVCI
jgi:hypothetical protein